jgi:hypothetical protein
MLYVCWTRWGRCAVRSWVSRHSDRPHRAERRTPPPRHWLSPEGCRGPPPHAATTMGLLTSSTDGGSWCGSFSGTMEASSRSYAPDYYLQWKLWKADSVNLLVTHYHLGPTLRWKISGRCGTLGVAALENSSWGPLQAQVAAEYSG